MLSLSLSGWTVSDTRSDNCLDKGERWHNILRVILCFLLKSRDRVRTSECGRCKRAIFQSRIPFVRPISDVSITRERAIKNVRRDIDNKLQKSFPLSPAVLYENHPLCSRERGREMNRENGTVVRFMQIGIYLSDTGKEM